MTTELWMLLATAGLQWILIMSIAAPGLLKKGLVWGMSNREEDFKSESPAFARTKRANANLQENLPLFIALVVVAQASGTTDSMTANGALVFFAARVAHAIIYIAGIPGLRTLSWVASIAGLGMIVAGILS